MKILYGKRTTLFPFTETDIDYFFSLLKHESELMGKKYFKTMESYFAYAIKAITDGRWMVFTLLTKPGYGSAKPEKFGFVIIEIEDGRTCRIHGLTDKKMMKGLLKLLKRTDKYTYAEDSLRVAIQFCFDYGFKRIEAETFESNRLCQKLLEKVGFLKSVYVYELNSPVQPEDKKEQENVIRTQQEIVTVS